MSEPLFNVVFYGILQPGKDREMVTRNMATLFKTEPTRLAGYFSGARKVIKANLNEPAAEKYRLALENAGLVIKIEAAASESPVAGNTDSNQAATSAATPATANEDISGITMAEVGANVIEHPVEVPAQAIEDISGITMAEAGADIVENPAEVPTQAIEDISDITLAEVGADMVENPKEKEKTAEPDISGLSLE